MEKWVNKNITKIKKLKRKIFQTENDNLAITNGEITVYTDQKFNLLTIKLDGEWVKSSLEELKYEKV